MNNNNNIFNKSKYTNWYYTIVNNALSRGVEDSILYKENHHIIPKSMNGSDDPTNMVTLTAREHFICHILLTKMCVDSEHKRKMVYAAFMMCHIESPGQQRYHKINSRLYETLKRDHAEYNSNRMVEYWNALTPEEYKNTCAIRKEAANRPEVVALKTHIGKDNGMYGKTHTNQVKQKLSKLTSERLKGKSYEDLYGKDKSDQLRQKRSDDMKQHCSTIDRTGTNNPHTKRAHIKGITFNTCSEAAEHFNVGRPCISYWIKTRDDCYITSF